MGTAGSACLVAQMLSVPLLEAAGPSAVTVTGGTHNRHAPPAEFLQRAFLPLLSRTGGRTELQLDRHGFEPAGGGRITLSTEPAAETLPLRLTALGPVRSTTARVLLARLPRHVGERELGMVRDELGWPATALTIEEVEADGPGNALVLEIEHPQTTAVFCSFGRPGLPAEEVAEQAVEQARRHLNATVPVGPHLADQLLVPLALRAGGVFRTVEPTDHFTTNVHTLQQFTDTMIEVTRQPDGGVLVRVGASPVRAG